MTNTVSQKEKILYIDDEQENLDGFRLTFYKEYEVDVALSAKKAFDMLESTHYKVIIADQRMPEMTGLDFFEELNKEKEDIICIICTAYADLETVLQAFNQGGIYKYILKPWQKSEMKFVIDSALERYNLKDENRKLIEELQRSELKFRTIFNNSTDGIIISDFEYNIVEANKPVHEISGYSPQELVKLKTTDLVEKKNINQLRERIKMLISDDKDPPPVELLTMNKTGKTIPIEVNSTLIYYEGRRHILSVIRDITGRKQMERKILNAIIETEEKERSRFAKELHDGLGPVLTTTKLYVQSLKEKKQHDIVKKVADVALKTIDEAIRSLTEISNNISPHVLKNFGISSAVKSFIQKLSGLKTTHISYNSAISGRYSESIELTMYRIIVELINNTVKHAGASKISIDLNEKDSSLLLIYHDNGLGFDKEEVEKSSSQMGISNIKTRVRTLGGNTYFSTSPGKGLLVNVSIPLNMQ